MKINKTILRIAVFTAGVAIPLTGLFAGSPGRQIAHDQVPVWSTPTSSVIRDHVPTIFFSNGCKPYPAVAPNGDYSAGLKARGGAARFPMGQRFWDKVHAAW